MKQTIFKAIDTYNSARNRVLNKVKAPIIVLMYHRVLKENTNSSLFTVTEENFKQQINYLKDNYNILNFEDDWSKVDKPSFVITFDDGYYDNYKIAKNFLSKERVPTTFFITTQNIGNNGLFWWDEISLHKDVYEKHSDLSLSQIFQKLINSKPQDQRDFLNGFHPFYPKQEKHYEINEYRSMTEAELYELAHLDSITIGAHTVNHPKLAKLNEDEILFELFESKKKIEKIIKRKVTTFSYPYGSYNRSAAQACKKVGFDKVATTTSKNCYAWSDKMKIPRVLAADDSIYMFKKKIANLLR